MKATLKDLELELWLRAREAGAIKWTTKTGKKISIKEMDTEHLVNTIKMLRRNAEEAELRRFFYEEAMGSCDSSDFYDTEDYSI